MVSVFLVRPDVPLICLSLALLDLPVCILAVSLQSPI